MMLKRALSFPAYGAVAVQAAQRAYFSSSSSSSASSSSSSSSKLTKVQANQKIDEANQEVLRRINAADLYLADTAPAGEVIPAFQKTEKLLLHSGPPQRAFEDMCAIHQGSLIGGVLLEGWAKTAQEAKTLLQEKRIRIEPCNHHNAVGPITGVIGPSLPVFVVENRAFPGTRAFSRPADMWEMWGNHDKFPNMTTWKNLTGPSLGRVLREAFADSQGLPLNDLLSQALEMGDDNGNRQVALTLLLTNALNLRMLDRQVPQDEMLNVLSLLTAPSRGGGGPRAVIGLSMAAAKAALLPAQNVPWSTIVTCMARNGTEWGIQVSGLWNGDAWNLQGQPDWFLAPSPPAQAVNFHGKVGGAPGEVYNQNDRGRDTGDSSIHETIGWGGMALAAASPPFLQMLGNLRVEQGFAYTAEMRRITAGQSQRFRLPILGSSHNSSPGAPVNQEGCPLGVDLRLVSQTGLTPLIGTGLAHRDVGHSVIARGLLRAPPACFEKATKAFAQKYQIPESYFHI